MAGTITHPTPVKHRSRGVVRTQVSITTDASGVATATAIGVGFGRLVTIFYDGGLDASASITITDDKTGATLFGPYVTGTEGTPVTIRPSTVITDNAGVAVTAAASAPNVNRPIIAAGRLKVGVTAGGNAETCSLGIVVDEHGVGDLARTV